MADAADVPRLHHVGYVVDDLERAAHDFARAYGTGPFVRPPTAESARLAFRGADCTWEREIALAAWGTARIEILTTARVEPPELADLLGGAPRLSHVGYRVADLEAEVARLERNGVAPFLEFESGPVRYRLFEDPVQAAYIELQQDHPALQHMDEAIAQAAEGWDGREPLRSLH